MKNTLVILLAISSIAKAELKIDVVNTRVETVRAQCVQDRATMLNAAKSLGFTNRRGEVNTIALCDYMDEAGSEAEMDNVVDACRSPACNEESSGIHLFRIN